MRLTLDECGILPRHAVLAALSGGVDSVVLLHLLCAARREGRIARVAAAHLHHGLRGAAADEDSAFCAELCRRWDVPFLMGRADVRAAAHERGLSLEAAAREERYAFLRDAAHRLGADCIATGHHMDDQAETVLLHLLRGSRRLRRDAYAMVELCDWIPAVLTGADDPSAIRASHCAAGSKQMWAEAWGGFPPETFFEALDPALLPIVRNISKTNRTCDHAAGTITPAWAQALGLPEGVVVGVGNIDAHAGAVGAGIRCGTVVLNLGTSACHMALMPSDEMGGRLVEGIFGQVDSSIVPGMVGFEAGLSAFGDVYAWFRNLLCWPLEELLVQPGAPDAQARQQLAEECRDKIMGRLTEEAERLELRADMPLATDWLNGRRNPYPAPELTGTLTGLRLSTTAPEIYYALAEATAFATKAILDHLAANGVAIERLTGIGGISQKSPFVMQLLADVTGREISVIDCKQACAMGSVVYATVIAGCYGSVEEAQRALCNFPARRYTPRDERHPLLMQRYERYKAQGGLPQR